MINIVVLYLGTVVVSIIVDKIHKYSLIKDLADNNYKLNIDKVNDINEEEDSGKYYIFIPIYNLYKSISDYVIYKNDVFFPTVAYRDGLIKDFTTMEKKMYQEHPNVINANTLEYRMYLKKKFAHKVVVDDSLVYFNLSLTKGLELVESEGKLSRESEYNQTDKLYNVIEKSLDEVLENNINSVNDKNEYLKQIELTKEFLNESRNYLEEQKNIKKLKKTK